MVDKYFTLACRLTQQLQKISKLIVFDTTEQKEEFTARISLKMRQVKLGLQNAPTKEREIA